MGMSVGGSGKVKAEPNVVPMIDIMLVLLIIFMLIIPQLNAGFDSAPPKGINLKPQEEDQQDQVLGIDKQGRYYYNKRPIANESLADTIRRVYGERTDYNIFVRADKELSYGKILDALDIVSRNGVVKARMIAEQQSGTVSKIASDNAPIAPSGGGTGGSAAPGAHSGGGG
jgi:biopolymer transport protein ExbD